MDIWIVMDGEDVEAVYYSQDKMFEKYPSLKEYVTENLCGYGVLYGALYAVKMQIADISEDFMDYVEMLEHDWRD